MAPKKSQPQKILPNHTSRKMLSIFLLSAVLFNFESAYALTVPQAVNSLQTSTPGLPTVDNPKGNIGFILANIFYTAADGSKNGMIRPQYLDGIGTWTSTGTSAYFSYAGNVGVGSTTPGQKLDVVGNIRTSGQLMSTVANGTAPITVNSSTVVTNLNADLLDGQTSAYFAPVASPTFTGTPSAPTSPVGTNTTQIATTAYVNSEISNDAPTKTGGGASGTWPISITGNAATASNSTTASSTPLLSSLGSYIWNAATTPSGYNMGIQSSFVSSAQGFQNYGSVMTMKTYSGGGGTLQMFTPYSPTYGGTGLQVRFGNYDVNGGDSWTGWKTLVSSDNISSFAPTLTGGGASGTWGISVNGTARSIVSQDTRATNDLPQDLSAGVRADFKQNSTNGLTDGGTYNGVLSFRSYGNSTDFSGGPALQLGYSANGNLWTRTSSSATAWNGWGKVVQANSAGNVGIGTSTPSTKLEVAGGHGDTKFRLYSIGNGATLNSSLDMWASEPGVTYDGAGIGNNVNGHPYYGRRNTTLGQSTIRFYQGNTFFANGAADATNSMMISSNGNVGIGNTTPSTKLHVTGDVAATGWVGAGCETGCEAGGGYSLMYANGNIVNTAKTTSATLGLHNGFEIQQGGSNYGQFNSWVHLNGYYGLYSTYNGAHFYPNSGSYGSWRIAGSRNGWSGLEFDGSAGNVSLMMNSDSVGFHNNSYGWKFNVNGGNAYVYDSTYGGGTGRRLLRDSDSSVTLSEIYNNGWFRNNASGIGLYNQATGNHFYSDGAYWNVAYGGTNGIRLRNGYGGATLGYLYGETSGNFGLLHNGGGWAVQVYPGGGGYLHSNFSTNAPTAASHVATKAYVDSAVSAAGGGSGKYTQTCNDWSARGWSSRDDCLKDGRWHLVFTNSASGAYPNAELVSAINAGADVKLYLPSLGVTDHCQSTGIKDSYAICLPATRYSGATDNYWPTTASNANKGVGANFYKSSGLGTCVNLVGVYENYSTQYLGINTGGCGPSVQIEMHWYIRY